MYPSDDRRTVCALPAKSPHQRPAVPARSAYTPHHVSPTPQNFVSHGTLSHRHVACQPPKRARQRRRDRGPAPGTGGDVPVQACCRPRHAGATRTCFGAAGRVPRCAAAQQSVHRRQQLRLRDDGTKRRLWLATLDMDGLLAHDRDAAGRCGARHGARGVEEPKITRQGSGATMRAVRLRMPKGRRGWCWRSWTPRHLGPARFWCAFMRRRSPATSWTGRSIGCRPTPS